ESETSRAPRAWHSSCSQRWRSRWRADRSGTGAGTDREQSGVEAALEQAQALTPRIRPALLRQRSGAPPPCALRVPFVTNPSRGRLTPSLAEHVPVDPPREDAPADHGINVN